MVGDSGQTRVLVVDPDAGRRLGLTLQLRELDCEVEAVARLQGRSAGASSVDVVVVAGPELTAICQACVDAQIAGSILAVIDDEPIAEVLAAGASDCLAQPVSRAQLRVRLAVAAARRSRTSAAAEAALRSVQSQAFLSDRLATVGTLTVGVAHEINNPLAWVVGNLGLLSDEFDNQVRMRERPAYDPKAVAASRARVRELLGRAQEGTERVHRIVRDLGRFGRADHGEDEAVDLHGLLDSAIEIADVQIRHRARLARDFRARGFARGGEARLGQVFLNLLINAGQAIEPGSSRDNAVRVSTRDLDDGRVEVAVSDTGSGIPEHVRGRIFEPFFTTKPAGEGTGIGLAISRDIVTSMGGEITVDSEVGRGTTFCVYLRGVAEADAPAPASAALSTSHHGSPIVAQTVRVLVIDDEPLIREMVGDALASYEVVAVDNGREALAYILAEDWDLILCDVILPEISGLDLYARIRQDRPALADKLVFMTGGEFSSSSSRGMRAPDGAEVRRLDKPFSIKSLRALAARAALPRQC